METLRYALRSLRSTPGFAIIVVLALALGIGANSAIFSIVNGIFLRPLPYAEPDRLIAVTSSVPDDQLNNVGFSWPRMLAVRERQTVFSDMAVSIGAGFTVTEGEGDPEQIQGFHVSQNFFPVLGVQPSLGRNFLPEEDRRGAEPVVILSDAFWKRRYGGDRAIVGRTIKLDGNAYTVVGVMPPDVSAFPMNQLALWMPRPEEVSFLVREQIDQGGFFFNVLGRLKPEATLQQAGEELKVIAAAYAQAFPSNVDAKATADAVPLLRNVIGDQRLTYALLFAAVACVLLIACANVANLVLARYAGRRKQVAIRFALGAKRRHVITQFVTENVLLALVGGAVGLAFATWAVKLVMQLGENFIPRAQEIALDPMVVAFTLGVSVVTGVALGLIPSWQVAKPQLTDALKESSRETTGRGHNRVRNTLMVVEVAVSFVLLIAASLLVNSFMRVQSVQPGFNPDGVFAGLVQVPLTRYPERSEQLAGFYGQLWHRLAAVPGAKSVALYDTPPLSGFAGPSPYAAVGNAIPPLGEQPVALRHIISPNAFDVLGVRIVHGRDFTEQDTPTSTPVVIINETMAQRLFPGENPIGRQIKSGMLQLTQEIVGVVADTHTQNLTQPPTAEMWYPVLQRPEGFTVMLVRTDGDPAALAGAVRAALKEVDPAIPVIQATTMAQFVEQSFADRRLTMAMLAVFAGLALVLASLGVYGVMAYSVGQRSSEIGVRMAMGARPGDVQRMVVRQGVLLTGLGVAIGVVAAWTVTRAMNALLFGVGAADPLTYLGITALLGMVAVLACWLPARRAARVDPLVALRNE